MNDKLVTLATYAYPEQAYLSKTKLEAEGIWSFVADENARTYAFAATQVRLLVREADAEKAAQALQGVIDDQS